MTKHLQGGPQFPGWNLNTRQKSLSFSLIALRVVLVWSYKPNCCSWVCWVSVASSVIKILWMQINFLCSIYYNVTTPLTCEPCGKHTGGRAACPFRSSWEYIHALRWMLLKNFLPGAPGDSAAQGCWFLHRQPTGATARCPPFHPLEKANAALMLLMYWYQVLVYWYLPTKLKLLV